MAGGIEKRLFATIATRALFMPDLTALDWRVLGLIGLHDGMTLMKAAQGKAMGAGCTASNMTLAREAQCSYAALCRSITKLERLNLIEKQDRRGGKGLTAIRVRYDPPDNVPQGDVQYDEPATLDDVQNDHSVIMDDDQSDGSVTMTDCRYDQPAQLGEPRPAENCDEQHLHYSPLRGELDVAEAKKLNSPKAPAFADRENVASVRVDENSGSGSIKKYPPEGGLPMVSLRRHLPPRFDDLPSFAQVPMIERALAASGGDPDRINATERKEFTSLLESIADAMPDEPTGQQAARLYGEMAAF